MNMHLSRSGCSYLFDWQVVTTAEASVPLKHNGTILQGQCGFLLNENTTNRTHTYHSIKKRKHFNARNTKGPPYWLARTTSMGTCLEVPYAPWKSIHWVTGMIKAVFISVKRWKLINWNTTGQSVPCYGAVTLAVGKWLPGSCCWICSCCGWAGVSSVHPWAWRSSHTADNGRVSPQSAHGYVCSGYADGGRPSHTVHSKKASPLYGCSDAPAGCSPV